MTLEAPSENCIDDGEKGMGRREGKEGEKRQ